MIQQNNEFSNDLNEEKKLEASSIAKTPTDFTSEKISDEPSFFMKYLRFIYIVILIFYTMVLTFFVAISSHPDVPFSESASNTGLIYIIFGDIILLQAIFATRPQVISFKKIRLLLPIISCILFIFFYEPYASNRAYKIREKEMNLSYKSELLPIFDKITTELPGTKIDCQDDCLGSLSVKLNEGVFSEENKKIILTKYFSEITGMRHNYNVVNSDNFYQNFKIETPSENIQLKCDTNSCTTISRFKK